MTRKILSPEEARSKSRAEFEAIIGKIRNYRRQLKLDNESSKIIKALSGVGYRSEHLLWGDINVRWKAAKVTASLMERHYRNAPAGRSYYMLSFADDCGTTSDRIPHLAITQLTEKVRRAIAKMGLHAIVMLEIHPLMNYPGGGAGRSLLLGAHAIAWTDLPFEHASHAAALCASPAWRCSLGARAVDIQPVQSGTIRNVVFYIMKQTPSVKNLRPSNKAAGAYIMMDNTVGYRDEFAFRLFEGQSQVELASVMFGIGEGARVRQAIRERVTRWHRSRREPVYVPTTFDVWAFWHQLRQAHGSKRFLPYRFDGGATKPRVVLSPPRTSAGKSTPIVEAARSPAGAAPANISPICRVEAEPLPGEVGYQGAGGASRANKVKRKRTRPPKGRASRPDRLVRGPRRDS